jgi:hypothetical protein
MHRSSETVAALAAALAKAQAELVNPEKSLTATIRTGTGRGGGAQLPLCAALDASAATIPIAARRPAPSWSRIPSASASWTVPAGWRPRARTR